MELDAAVQNLSSRQITHMASCIGHDPQETPTQ